MYTLEQLQNGSLLGIKRLKLSCDLTDFPEEIYALADSLEILDLSQNKLSALPSDFSKLYKLKIFFASDNLFETFPEVLAECENLEMIGFKANIIKYIPENSFPKKLRWLILTNNKITKIPFSIGQCSYLQKCMLAGNFLTELPVEMSNCTNIELLRISANRFNKIPEWIFKLPKLAWLAIAGNPCTELNLNKSVTLFDWNQMQILEELGQGASGNIFKVEYDNKVEYALKIFKGELTSDGLPESEMFASLSVGSHPNLVSVVGKMCNHPENKKGLVMNLIPAGYFNLGLPPSFDSCTRDCFTEKTYYTVEQIYKIIKSVASVSQHIHKYEIMHGDLYAHNTLINKELNVLFGDFGAGVNYSSFNNNQKQILEKIEVRAFGYLIDDLLKLVSESEKQENNFRILENLRQQCLIQEVELRPNFNYIVDKLS